MPFFRLTQYQSWFTMLNMLYWFALLPYTIPVCLEGAAMKHPESATSPPKICVLLSDSISGNLTPVLVSNYAN